MIPKNSLIISYYFPPNIMVGGRRWAKFSKYLNRDKSTPIWVLTFDSTSAFVGPWNEDIAGLENRIARIPIKTAPYFKRKITSSSLVHKIKFKASYYLHKTFLPFTKGDSSDLVCNYKSEVVAAIKKIVVEKNISTIIVTGAPFRLCYYAALVKETFSPSLNLIVDYRDFWIEGSVFARLSEKRKKQELQFEQKVVEQANTILAVNTMILDRIRKYHPSVLDSKLIELPHAFDPEDLPTTNYDLKSINDKTVRMIYAGSLYPNMEFSIALLGKSIQFFLSKGYTPRVDIYSYTNLYKDVFEKEGVAEYVFYHDLIPAKQLFETMCTYDVLLQPRASVVLEQNFKSSKFYELVALRKPILYLGDESELGDFITKENLGVALYKDAEIERKIIELIEIIYSKKQINKLFDIHSYSFLAQTEFLKTIIK